MVYDPVLLGIDGRAGRAVMSLVLECDETGRLRHYVQISMNLMLVTLRAIILSFYEWDSGFGCYIGFPPPNLFSTDFHSRTSISLQVTTHLSIGTAGAI